MAKKITNFDALISAVADEITNTLNRPENQKKIKQVMRHNVVTKVYAAYPNPSFKRRSTHGGLNDYANMKVGVKKVNSKNITMRITNDAEPVGFDKIGQTRKYLDRIIEEGTGGSADWQKPRPFMRYTEEELRQKKTIEKILTEK